MVPVAHPHPEISKVPPHSAVFSKIRFSGFTCPAVVNSFFRDDYTSCILNLLLTNKVYCLGFFKTRVCFFGCYPASRGFSLASILTFTKSFASIACQSRSWFVSYQNTKRFRKR